MRKGAFTPCSFKAGMGRQGSVAVLQARRFDGCLNRRVVFVHGLAVRAIEAGKLNQRQRLIISGMCASSEAQGGHGDTKKFTDRV
ncbi:hypothetical protein HSBAA_PA_3480 (plasmid) [Vreelandella sulfidaeris]|uniref:Uncharacterized protein n=1 Tax=Vreelandella sulfidaeris TaxID=115553 RepID=A0A455UI02_9GAMM|nr:hypothetical protein HSBAA_PA_3480 [Halomonas sulfidaeris]